MSVLETLDVRTIIGNALYLFAEGKGWDCHPLTGYFEIQNEEGSYIARIFVLPEKIPPYKIDAEKLEVRWEIVKALGYAINKRLLKRRREEEETIYSTTVPR